LKTLVPRPRITVFPVPSAHTTMFFGMLDPVKPFGLPNERPTHATRKEITISPGCGMPFG
jgi:hypothetical protein